MEPDERRRRLDALYPVGEKRAEAVRTRSGRPIADITLAAVVGGRLGIVDIGISAEGLKVQAEVARLAGRETLARNFERGAELVDAPDDLILAVYELLRPGRAASQNELFEMARRLRDDNGAERIADLIDEAAEIYERRGLFRKRF